MNLLWSELFDGSLVESSLLVNFCQQNETIVLATLPALLSELAGVSNFNEMFQLVNSCGGRKIYLPKNSTDFYKMSGVNLDSMAYQHWRRLARVNGQVEVSSRWGVFLALRRAAIYQAMRAETDSNDIVLSFGITQRQLRSIKNKFK